MPPGALKPPVFTNPSLTKQDELNLMLPDCLVQYLPRRCYRGRPLPGSTSPVVTSSTRTPPRLGQGGRIRRGPSSVLPRFPPPGRGGLSTQAHTIPTHGGVNANRAPSRSRS